MSEPKYRLLMEFELLEHGARLTVRHPCSERSYSKGKILFRLQARKTRELFEQLMDAYDNGQVHAAYRREQQRLYPDQSPEPEETPDP